MQFDPEKSTYSALSPADRVAQVLIGNSVAEACHNNMIRLSTLSQAGRFGIKFHSISGKSNLGFNVAVRLITLVPFSQ